MEDVSDGLIPCLKGCDIAVEMKETEREKREREWKGVEGDRVIERERERERVKQR